MIYHAYQKRSRSPREGTRGEGNKAAALPLEAILTGLNHSWEFKKWPLAAFKGDRINKVFL